MCTSTALQGASCSVNVPGPQASYVLICPECLAQPGGSAGSSTSACPLCPDLCAAPIATYGCRIKQACWHLCICHCDVSVAGNLSHSECTCENPNLCMLPFVCITFQGSQFNYQGEVTVLWVQRPFVHAELHHFLTFFASDVTKLQESAISSLSPPSGALFFFSCYSGDPLVFLVISIYSFSRKISVEACQRNTPQTQQMHYLKTPCNH